MPSTRLPWFTVLLAPSLFILAVYGSLHIFDAIHVNPYEEDLERLKEAYGDGDPTGETIIALFEQSSKSPRNSVLEQWSDWVMAWFYTEPIGATLVISLGLGAFSGLLLLPVFIWNNTRRLADIVENQEAMTKLLHRNFVEDQKNDPASDP